MRLVLISSATQRDGSAQPFFSVVPAYVLLFKAEDGNWCIDAARTELGRAVTCFLSPFDAMIEAAHFVRRGYSHQVMAASEIEESLFRDADGRGLISDIHLGWSALDSRILARPDGAFGRGCRLMHHWAVDPAEFEVDGITLTEYSRFRELAGLYAWQEPATDILGSTDARRQMLAECAIESIERMRAEPKDCRQLALFDPEFEWHFVPYTETAQWRHRVSSSTHHNLFSGNER
jgi:hypothetical protein